MNRKWWGWYLIAIIGSDITKPGSYANRELISLFNLSYFVENRDSSDQLAMSIQETKDNLYDNGKIRIWWLDKI